MKHIIIEGGDNLGKNTLIKNLSDYYNFDNVIIRHFGKPPKLFVESMSPLEFQIQCFYKEAQIADYIRQLENDEYNYYENILIWNRSHLGEYVYSQMFRGEDPEKIEIYLNNYESANLINNPDEIFLILLTADPSFFLSKEDGKSFSKNIEEKTKELKLFNEVFEKSLIDNKLILKVNDGKSFLPERYIFNEILNFISKNK